MLFSEWSPSFVKQNRVKLSKFVMEILNFIWHNQEAETCLKN
jgi:hypothetical protein